MEILLRSKRIIILTIMIFSIIFTIEPSNAQVCKITVGVGANTTAFLPLFVAQEKGFFKDEGVDVKITFLAGGGPLMKAMVSRDVDIGAGGTSEPFFVQEEGEKLCMFWGVSNIMPYKLHAGPTVKSDKDMKGKIFAISSYGALTDSLTRYVISKYDLDPEKDTKILQVGSIPARYAALKAGRVDIAILDEPFCTKGEREGFKAIVDLRDLIKEWQYEVFYGMKDYLEKNDACIKKFLRGYRKGVVHTKDHPAESIKINSKALGFSDEDSEIGYNFFVKSFFVDGHIEERGMVLALEFERKAGRIKKIKEPKEVIDFTYINYFAKEK